MRAVDVTTPPERVEPVTFARVVVPLDGSAFAQLALWPARALSPRFGAELRLLGVGVDDADAEALAWRLDPLAKEIGATFETPVGRDVPATILDVVAERERTLLCLASHGRGRLSGAALGSVANGVLAAADQPVMLVGPQLEPQRSLTEGPVLACVDGSSASEALIPVAASWATALGVPLGITTVAEPMPQPLDDRPYRRLHGPTTNAQAYVDGLATAWEGRAPSIIPVALYDPLGPAEGLSQYLEQAAAGLLVVNTHARTGLSGAILGSQVTAIVSISPVPVLVAPRARDW
jgi:nucleotide-binding universal stress UspA family protein